jgi:hypothetical protein
MASARGTIGANCESADVAAAVMRDWTVDKTASCVRSMNPDAVSTKVLILTAVEVSAVLSAVKVTTGTASACEVDAAL